MGGRRSLNSDVDYTLQPAADGSGTVVLLRNADAIIAPLATLGRVEQAPTAPQSPMDSVEATTPNSSGAAPPTQQPTPGPSRPIPPSAPSHPTSARPSFDCDRARTKGEVAVCSDAGLAALDRTMAAQFGRAMSRVLAYRDRCPNRQCIGDAYVGRMREIRDIMEGRWQPER